MRATAQELRKGDDIRLSRTGCEHLETHVIDILETGEGAILVKLNHIFGTSNRVVEMYLENDEAVEIKNRES